MIIRKSPTYNSRWLALSLNSRVGRHQVDLVTYGAAQEQINIGDAVNFVIPTPPLFEQNEISEYCNDIIESKIKIALDKITKSISLLQEYRSALISAAVTGKIDVRDTLPTSSEASS
jgi:type I restriction enzyme S subunit